MPKEKLIEYLPLFIIIGSVLVGLFLQILFTRYFKKLATKTRWQWDDIVVIAIGNFPLYGSVLLGIYFLILRYDFGDDKYKNLITDIFFSVVILSVTVVIARFIGSLVAHYSRKTSGRVASTSLFANGSRILIYIVGGVVVMQNLDIQITPIITALGLGGLAVALALEETLNNLFCGIQIVASRFVRIGDYVKLEDQYEGYVTDIKARNTTIRSFPDNNRIIVPNSRMASSIVINYSMPERNLWITIPVGIAYDSDLDQVEHVTLEVAKEVCESVDGGLKDFDPVFFYNEFADSSINFTVRLYVKRFRDQFKIRHEFIKRLHKRFAAENIEIPFPIRTLYMRNTESDPI